MRRVIEKYTSKFGVQFHHTITTFENPPEEKKSVTEFLPETHFLCELFLLIDGSVTYNIEGQTYNFSPNDAIFILPNKLHSLEFDATRPYERMVLHFSPTLISAFSELNLFSSQMNFSLPTVIPKHITERYKITELMFKIRDICKEKPKYMHLHLSSVILQLVEALDNIILNLSEDNALLPIKVNRISHNCIKYINENLLNKQLISPQNIAKELHVSLSHLQHTFKKEMGVSLHNYILKQKMQLAKQLLLQGKLPQEVASILGYEYYSTFYHNFQQYFLAPPTSCAKIEETLYANFKTHES